MVFEERKPCESLVPFIDSIVYYEGYTAEHKADKLLPDGGIYMIIDMLETPGKLYKDESLSVWQEFTGAYLSGQHRHFIFIDADHSSNMAVKFKPGGAYPFLPGPISIYNDKVQQLEPIVGEKISQVRKAIISSNSIDEKFSLLETYIESLKNPSYIHDEAFFSILEQMERHPENLGIKELSKLAGCTQKHLISLFNKRVGLTPKSLLRIFRFQKVIQSIEKEKEIDWMQIATDCGYYDHAHFAKDFYNFSGINPSKYNSSKGDNVNYLPIN